ncbi:aspartyl-phosphate phosphatase Spo0E family protein [Sediminibacillus albus]|uniref:Spo0E like sporulation regulatory protein n=1 Tax=Sediminibacillus albus TaxID=407036 RepID=A0A1G8WCE2_9BACI|nr:aspartyl-phosphate phosphatase Spo0E family protein [Sediminibacillus albus]SDJ75894.1 Spo0E like sporulation regulatory protein [Sediminibacillus albus]
MVGYDSGRELRKLQEKIAQKRAQMIHTAKDQGLSSLLTLKLSQELDALLNQYSATGQAFNPEGYGENGTTVLHPKVI